MAATIVGFGDISFLVEKIGISDPSLRLILALFAGIPCALIYRGLVRRQNAVVQHLYFTLCGIVLAGFAFGWGLFHGVLSITVAYLILQICGSGIGMVITMFLFNMVYIVSGYVRYSTAGYDVNWTTLQCILCLRLIGVGWDVYDGHQDQETLSADFKTTALGTAPNLLQMFGHSYFYGGFLVGPQFPMKKYLQFVHGKLMDGAEDNSCISAGLWRLVGGVLYLAAFAIMDPTFSSHSLLTDDFQHFSFLKKIGWIAIFGKVALMKYLAVWLIAESSCIMSGISYNGKDAKGRSKWDGLRNMSLTIYETAWTFQHIVDSFNLNTNKWVFRYFFKRMRFLGNKNLSHFLTLMFLALWHGIFIGYFISFAMEFLTIIMEKQLFDYCHAVTKKRWSDLSQPTRTVIMVVGYIVRVTGLSYFSAPFVLLTAPRIHKVYSSTYYIFPVIIILWHPLKYLVLNPLKRSLAQEHKVVNGTASDKTDKERLKKVE